MPGKTIGCDVRNFITEHDELVRRVVNRYKLKRNTMNETALACQRFVVRFLTYKYDDDLHKTPEFWQFPFETLQSEHGDCEDGAILMAALCIHSGIPYYRVKVAAGYVQDSPTAPTGGHAYCIYLGDTKMGQNWIILDWCYAEDSRLSIDKKPLAKEGGYNNCYKEVWFTFNNEMSWHQTSLVLGNRISNDHTLIEENSVQRTTGLLDSILINVDTKMLKE